MFRLRPVYNICFYNQIELPGNTYMYTMINMQWFFNACIIYRRSLIQETIPYKFKIQAMNMMKRNSAHFPENVEAVTRDDWQIKEHSY